MAFGEMPAHAACEAILTGPGQPHPAARALACASVRIRACRVRLGTRGNVSAFNAWAAYGALKIDMRATPLLWFLIFCFFEILYR
ncbi:hypothetical protein C9I57_02530 [Trinickia symbiotica]|uniref:Uncharacterized protein n=1 Tax=Trinickia symbiotica TaxID=863227 RepID=A0A2T3Y1N2_9BURK|nr:hypothetical protein C9I57_02530 [Trinickia symbiotica]